MSTNSVNNSSGYENSTWVEDWSANLDAQKYIDSLPKGVNTVNIFVGQLDWVNGKAKIDGFSGDTPGRPAGTGAFLNEAALTDFISKLKAKGITVKLSIGGQSGTNFGNSWKNLLGPDGKVSSTRVQDFAQALADFAKKTGADGIDFDDEMENTTVAAAAGQLAASLKEKNPDLKTSFDVFGGINAQGPTHAVDKVFMENAKLKDGQSAIDRVYVMSYYDGASLQQNEQYLLQWKDWLGKNFSFSPSQLSVGVDPNDPTTSPSNKSLQKWIEFAKKNGLSTAVWDQQGVDDYVKNDWGSVINKIYNQS